MPDSEPVLQHHPDDHLLELLPMRSGFARPVPLEVVPAPHQERRHEPSVLHGDQRRRLSWAPQWWRRQ